MQNIETSKRVNFDMLKDLVEGYLQGNEDKLHKHQTIIRRGKRGFNLKKCNIHHKV